ncbi:DUF397 domain-containing protein [Actinokineospora iranica]|uniref:DUF397 domain-containing protein n=1 Tax=Actinokineospora iranica TaxID=1271860 RepID=A0A1G6YWC0_9PSEU|nr:DUF397 domain-containing protein [Actinokineospora iranica]SDD94638.1 protein of unknown function [Actinokineospora iranica]
MKQAQWRKSSHSVGNPEQCVEVAQLNGAVAVRDSKNPNGPVVVISHGPFIGLLSKLKDVERAS